MAMKPMSEKPTEKTISPTQKTITFLDNRRNRVTLSTQIVKQYICDKATDLEALLFMRVCHDLGANPFLRQIYLIKYDEKSPAQIVVSRDFFLQIAAMHPAFRGMRSGIIVRRPKKTQLPEGVLHAVELLKQLAAKVPDDELRQQLNIAIQLIVQSQSVEYETVFVDGAVYQPGDEIIGGWAEVYVRNPDDPQQPIVFRRTVPMSEYNTGKSSWKEKPATMICKVAEHQALRAAFPINLANVYTPEEILGIQSHEFSYQTPITASSVTVENIDEGVSEDDKNTEQHSNPERDETDTT